jgi:hypothetical protein
MPHDLGRHYRLQHLNVQDDLGTLPTKLIERANCAKAQHGVALHQVFQQHAGKFSLRLDGNRSITKVVSQLSDYRIPESGLTPAPPQGPDSGPPAGLSLTEVAKKHRISRATVCRLVKESGRLKRANVPHADNQESAVLLVEASKSQVAA